MKRTKRRYLALKIDSSDSFTSGEFMATVWKAVTRLYGENGASRTGLVLIHYNEGNKSGVLRTSLDSLDMTRAALASITEIRNRPAAVHVMMISGTIKSLRAQESATRN